MRPPAHGFDLSPRHADRASPLAIVPSAANESHLGHFIERDGMRFAGTHLIIDLRHAMHFDDLRHVEQALRDATERAGATLLNINIYHVTPNGALSREPQLKRDLTETPFRSCSSGRTLPWLGRVGSEQAQRAAGGEVALEIERVVNGGGGGEEALG